MTRRYVKVYPREWRGDPRVRICSYAARGLWADILMLMAEADNPGELTIAGEAVSAEELARIVCAPAKQVCDLLHELHRAGLFGYRGNVIYAIRPAIR